LTPSNRRSRVVLVVGGLALAGCGTPDPPASQCVAIKTDCNPFYVPTYANVFAMTLMQTCAAGTGTCHSDDARKGGLYFVDSALAYQLLLGMGPDKRARVLPNNPGCSILAQRLESTVPNFRMPPGAGLTPPELCAVVQWMANGAPQF